MTKNLSDALKAAKKSRNVLSKLIIWESGVSKTQFYRIINGEESPSPESKKKISDALGIDVEKFDLLQKNSRKKQGIKSEITVPKNKWLAPFLIVFVVILSLILLTMKDSNQHSGPKIVKNIANPEDGTLFIMDVTLPDGTSIPINTKFEKTWRVKNIGKVVWKDRYLMRMTPASNGICDSPSRVPIPETLPGQTIDISVTFTTPHLPGSCRTDWKTTDKDGNLYFPDMHGLYSIVVVVDE